MTGPVAQHKKGDDVEGFRVLDELGQGAASTIYLVQDLKNKQVWALKHVKRETDKDERFLDQAIYEHTVASKLDHEHIRKIPRLIKKTKRLIQVCDVYLVMEMLDGISMDRRPPRTFDDALTIFIQSAKALRHMHERGFVHADMKPNNILVTAGPVAKLIDLGQSCKIGTVKERIQGTPDYIAPEQVHRREITPRTDVYNLGATMYWTLTQRHIPTALAKPDALVSRIDDALMERPTPAIEINKRIPDKLSELIAQCVEVDPSDRPDGMGYVADRLELILGLVRSRNQDSGGRSMGGGRAGDAHKTSHGSSAGAIDPGASAPGLSLEGPGQA